MYFIVYKGFGKIFSKLSSLTLFEPLVQKYALKTTQDAAQPEDHIHIRVPIIQCFMRAECLATPVAYFMRSECLLTPVLHKVRVLSDSVILHKVSVPSCLVHRETLSALGSEGTQIATEAGGYTALVVSVPAQALTILISAPALLAFKRLILV